MVTKKELFATYKAIFKAQDGTNKICLKLRGKKHDHCRAVTDKLFDAKLKLDIVWEDNKLFTRGSRDDMI